MSRLSLSLMLAVLVACGPQSRVSPCSPSAMVPPKPTIPVVFVGESVDLELLLPPAVFCQNGNPVATDVSTTVLDSHNAQVQHTHDAPSSSNTKGYGTTVHFTPLEPGVHYLSAHFEPSLGIAQRQVQVVRERAMDAPVLRIPLAMPCDEVWGLPEAALCRRGARLEVLGDRGQLISSADVSGVASSGGVGWWWTRDRVTRATVVDGGVTLSSIDVSVPTGPRSVSPGAISFPGFLEVALVDGGLSAKRWSPSIDGGPSGIGFARSEQVYGFSTGSLLCSVAELDASVRCVESALVPGDSSGPTLWLRGAETGSVAQARFAPLVGEPVVVFLPGQSGALNDTRQGTPSFTWNGRLVTIREDDLTLDAFRTPGPVLRQSTTAEHVVYQLQSNELVLFAR